MISGILLLDKPAGLSSNAALQIVKRLYHAHKAGHCGSLDPLATGLLPICLGEATKVSGFLLNASKSYRFTCRLGISTSTGDAEGNVVRQRPVEALDPAAVETVLAQFRGQINQLPPMYSALKQAGQRLYQLARQGVEVERQPRQVTVYTLQLLRIEGEYLECEMHCSKGTYVRTLAADLGEALGCGAHVTALRRTAVEPFDTSRMVTLQALQEWATQGYASLDARLLPLDAAIVGWPIVRVHDDAAHFLRQGQAVLVPRAPTQGRVRLYQHERFLGIGEILDDGRVAPRRLVLSH